MVNLIRASLSQPLEGSLLRNVWVKDIQAGLVVAIVSLPLSLSLALASGFPPFAGILSSFIGGFLLSFISGSETAIKGPATGLGAITLTSVYVLGNGNMSEGYTYTLAAIVFAGLLQIVSALVKMGNLGNFFPSAVVHGMLASLGLTMVLKQIPYLLGIKSKYLSNTEIISNIPEIISNANPIIAALGLSGLIFIFAYSTIFKNFSKAIPSIIPTLIIGIPVAISLGLIHNHEYEFMGYMHYVDAHYLFVNFDANFIETLKFPDFNKMADPVFWFYVVLFFLACNIESILTCKSIDQLDAQHRQTNFNKDLIALGVGNIICGLLGGLPIISESKRSTVSLSIGAKSIAANFFNSIFLGGIILLFWPVIGLIPLCLLSAYLIYMGIKLTLPKEFSKTYDIGKEQLLVFVLVFLTSIKFNFLVGVIVGVGVEFMVNLRPNISFSSFFRSNMVLTQKDKFNFNITVNGPAIFSNYIWAKKILDKVPSYVNIIIDFSDATVVDHSFIENISHFQAGRKLNGGQIELKGFEYHTHVSNHPLSTRRITDSEANERQKQLSQYALESGMEFSINIEQTAYKNFQNFDIHEHIKIVKIENTLSCEIDSLKFTFNDISTETSDLTHRHFNATVLLIENFYKNIPNFILQKDGFDESILNTSHSTDINYEQYKAFSYYYFLTGKEETEIRKFFDNSKIIHFFEAHRGYNLSYSNGKSLIYKRQDLLAIDEMENMVQYALDFVNLIQEIRTDSNNAYPNLF